MAQDNNSTTLQKSLPLFSDEFTFRPVTRLRPLANVYLYLYRVLIAPMLRHMYPATIFIFRIARSLNLKPSTPVQRRLEAGDDPRQQHDGKVRNLQLNVISEARYECSTLIQAKTCRSIHPRSKPNPAPPGSKVTR
ncbi:hypothetical protein EVAR_83865_1 [Eumeta japonica]|uniref:Uncharacterized protein n=1 Tax=Eumeta variegata TaxID=151549 RepID=A0A4C1USK1_EUMVA|nr:hypothetical protein EVAR_83865_1 [Eumeta japonica]